jgi:vanillate O-demethylase monooxygenase subunit
VTNWPTSCWYVAATSDEVAASPVARRLLGEDVVLWRSADGRLAAFENRCAHRAFPLSHGTVHDDQLVCGYHGCTYDRDGSCVRIPSQNHVPAGMRLRSFPVHETPPFVWVWLGAPRSAAGRVPPTLPWVGQPDWESFTSDWTVNANYLMVHEHYLDFSYAPIVHAGDIPAGIQAMPPVSDVEITETTVSYTRVLPNAPLTDWEAETTGLDRSVSYRRRELGTFASPALHLQRWDVDDSGGNTFSTIRIHGITPADATSTNVYMIGSRNYRLDDPAITDRLRRFLESVAARDNSILEMASDHSGYHRWQAGVEFQADAPVIRARNIVATMIASERRSLIRR